MPAHSYSFLSRSYGVPHPQTPLLDPQPLGAPMLQTEVPMLIPTVSLPPDSPPSAPEDETPLGRSAVLSRVLIHMQPEACALLLLEIHN